MRTFCSILFLLILSGRPARAQQPFFRHFTTRDGLPSNVIYDIFYDSKGFIWFCTDQGISCYDGSRFRNYSINEGLPDNEVFGMGEDGFGRYWLVCYNHRACYLYEGRVRTAANDALCRQLEKDKVIYTSVFSDSHGVWYLKGKRIYALSPTGVRRAYPGLDSLQNAHYHATIGGSEYLLSGDKAYIGNRDGSYLIKSLSLRHTTAIAYTGGGNRLYHVSGSSGRDTLYTYTVTGPSIRLNRKNAVPALCYELEYQPDSSVLCLTAAGMYVYNKRDGTFRRSAQYPPQIPFNRIVHDREGNTWLATLNDGAYLRSRQPVSGYNVATGLPENNVLAVFAQDRAALTICFGNGNFSLVENGRLQHYYLPQSGGTNRIKFAYRLRDGRFLAGGDRGLYLAGPQVSSATQLMHEPQKACTRLGHRYYLAHSGGFSCYDDSTGTLTTLCKESTTAIATGDGRTVWLGSLDGLYCWQSGSVRKFERDATLSANRIVGLSVAGCHYLVIATHRSGLYTWNGERLRHIDRSAGLASDNCRSLCTDSSGAIWLCTDQGLDRLSPAGGGTFSIHHYTAADGLPEGKVNAVALQGNRLCVATTEGLVMLDNSRSSFPSYPAPAVYLLSVSIRDSLVTWPRRKLELSYRENSLQVSYTGVLLTGGPNLEYRYVLEGGNGDTMHTKLNVINLSNLRPGDYRLLLWARAGGGADWTAQPAALAFGIRPPFWLSPWFIALCAGLAGSGIYTVYRLKVRSVRRREAAAASQQQHMAVLKMQALRSQINPHFMFNALNSIQHFYSQDEDRKANQYLGIFTRLIRKALNHSEQHWLRLAEEIDMLTAYLNLEQMRFKSAFDYSVQVDPAIDPYRVMVPTMLLQPYVENAIGHGLRGLQEGKGLLRLRFGLTNDMLVCSVEDNGTGIRESRSRHPEGQPSFGMSLTAQRIDTLNALYQTNIRVAVHDRRETVPAARGTLVVLYVPIRNYYE